MAKLESFKGCQTKWEGLWWHPEYQGFSSKSFNLAGLRSFKGNFRLYVRKNRFYNNGENGRPNYCFCFRDSQSDTFKGIEIEYESEKEATRAFTYDQLQDLINKVAVDVGGDGCYGEYLVTDYIDWR